MRLRYKIKKSAVALYLPIFLLHVFCCNMRVFSAGIKAALRTKILSHASDCRASLMTGATNKRLENFVMYPRESKELGFVEAADLVEELRLYGLRVVGKQTRSTFASL